MRIRVLAVCVTGSILALGWETGATRAQAPAAPDAAPKVEFEKYRLPNGLDVILHVDRKLPIVHVNQWFHVGSKNEKPGRTGFAHLFEHMMFQGSKHAKEEYFTYAEKAGANLFEGGVNGTTDTDRTNYFVTAPSANLENLLWFESDRLASLLEALDQKKLDNQRDVVKNERRQGLENQPYGRWFKLFQENLFPAGHPYSWPVIGSHEDLTAASLEDVKEFFRQYYAPNNLSLVIAGDFDVAQAKSLVAKYFGGIPPGPALDRPARFIPTLSGERVVEVSDRVPQERVYLAWPSPEYFAAGDAELDLAARILGDGLSSRLNKALVYDRQLCSAVSAFQVSAEISGGFVVVATARPGASLAEVEKIVSAEIARLGQAGPLPAELARARTKQEFEFVSGLERIGGFGGKADVLNKYNTYLGDPGKMEDDLGRYRKATASSVRAAVRRWLDTTSRVVIRFHPEVSERAAGADLDRAQMPPLGADRPFVAPQAKQAKLDNGLELFVVERPELPKVAAIFTARAGAIADPPGKEGLAHLTMVNIDLGTRTRKALEIEDALGDLGTSLSGSAGREAVTLSFEVLARHLPSALGVLSDVVRNPVFPASEFDRELKRHLDALAQQSKNANAVAGRVRSMLAFGREHPYGRPAQGLPATVESVRREDLVAFHAARYRPAGSALILVGAVTLDQATSLARERFGDWTGAAPEPVAVPARSPAPAGRIYLVDRPDAAQSVVSLSLPSPTRKEPDFYALQLADAVWGGGGFGTRLNLNLREDKGYSYGVFSTLNPYQQAGFWYAGGGVQTNKTKESVLELDKELKDLAGARPISAAEFETARLRKLRGYAQQFESYSRVAEELSLLWALGLPTSELQREGDEAGKATLPEVLSAARKYAQPEMASLLVVGDRAKVEAGLRELKLGELVLLDADGMPAN